MKQVFTFLLVMFSIGQAFVSAQTTGGVTAKLTDSPAIQPAAKVNIKLSDQSESTGALPAVRIVAPAIPEARPLAGDGRTSSNQKLESVSPLVHQTVYGSIGTAGVTSQENWEFESSPQDPQANVQESNTNNTMLTSLTNGAVIQVTPSTQTVELLAGASRRLVFPHKVAEVIVESPEFVRASPVSASQVTVTGVKLGVSTITFSDPEGNMQTIAINVKPDVRKAQVAIAEHFPDSAVKVSALSTGIVLSGFVARSEDVDGVLAVARDFFPTNIVNLLQVEGAQVVAIEVKVYEVSRTKLRRLGVDWSVFGTNVTGISGFGDLIQNFTTGVSNSPDQNMALGVITDDTRFNMLINALEKRNVAKLLSQPTLVAQNGRPAEFLSGGEIPFQIANGFGTNSIQFRPFGTKLDFVPVIQGEGHLTLEVRAEVSEIANDLSFNTGVPGFRVRRVNTGVPMRHGQTLALAGDYTEKSDAEASGAPGLVNVPFWGVPFRTTRDNKTETELVFLITPRFIDSIDPEILQCGMPGRNSVTPTTRQLLFQGQIEVPGCAPNTDVNVGSVIPTYPGYEQVPLQSVPNGMPQSNYIMPYQQYPQSAAPAYPIRR